MDNRKNIILAAILLLFLTTAGTAGYVILEGYSILDGFYMTIITITTVGFGEIRPLSEIGRLFTAILILFGFGALAFFGQTVVAIFLEKFISQKSELRRMKRQIDQLKGHFIICGFGRVGAIAASRFLENGVDIVVIESDNVVCQELKEKEYLYLEGDAINEEKLIEAGIKSARGLLAILPSDPDNLFITLSAREFNPTLQIIARAGNNSSEKKLLRAGADSVISPYTSAGNLIANMMLSACGFETGARAEETAAAKPRWVDITSDSWMVHKSIEDVGNILENDVLGLRRGDRDFLDPEKSITLKHGDKILILDYREDTGPENTGNIPRNEKIVIVDDNPVILRLYTRLLHRAGFIPLSAANGQGAVDLIIKEKPHAAVVDFMLPILSGIEVCRRVREALPNEQIKLILFTSDENEETRRRALAAGADTVIIKSAEASDLVEHIVKLVRSRSQTTGNSSSNGRVAASWEHPPSALSPPLFQPDSLLKTCDGDYELALEIIDIFLEDSHDLMEQIICALETADHEKLRMAAHTLKGAVSNFGESPLYQNARVLEQMGKEGNLNTANLSVELLQKQLRQFQQELSLYRQRPTHISEQL